MKTPLEELIEWKEKDPVPYYYHADLEDIIKKLIVKEKQAIIDAWNDGCYNEKNGFPKSGEEYYERTFKKE
jgi:hypothetical protein